MIFVRFFAVLMLDEANHCFVANLVEFWFIVRGQQSESGFLLLVSRTSELPIWNHLNLKIGDEAHAATELDVKSLFVKNFPESIDGAFPSFAIVLTGRTFKSANCIVTDYLNFPYFVLLHGEFIFLTDYLNRIWHVMGANLFSIIQIQCFGSRIYIECPGTSNIINGTALLLASNGLVSMNQQQFVKNS